MALALLMLCAASAAAFSPSSSPLLPRLRLSSFCPVACPQACQPARERSKASLVMMAKGKKPTSSDKVQVILKGNVDGVGKQNEVLRVNIGYYNNFLRPKALADIISDEEVEVMVAKHKEELAQKKQEAEELASEVKKLGDIVLLRKVGKGNQIFGSVTNKQIIEEVSKKSGGKGEDHSLRDELLLPDFLSPVQLSAKMKWEIPEVSGLGEYSASVQVHPEVTVGIRVVVKEQ
eukprot:766055-Hanusia_phi.AAC.4